MRADDLVLVGAAGTDIGDEDLPDAGVLPVAHGMAPAVPVVEIADNRNPLGVGSPDGEVEAGCALMLELMRAQLVEEPEMRALGDIVVVHRAEHRTEGIGIGQPPVAAGVARVIAKRLALADLELAFEEAAIVAAGKRACLFSFKGICHDGFGVRHEAARDEAAGNFMHAKDRKRIAMRACDDRLDIAGCGLRRRAFCRGGARLLHLPSLASRLSCRSLMQSHHT